MPLGSESATEGSFSFTQVTGTTGQIEVTTASRGVDSPFELGSDSCYPGDCSRAFVLATSHSRTFLLPVPELKVLADRFFNIHVVPWGCVGLCSALFPICTGADRTGRGLFTRPLFVGRLLAGPGHIARRMLKRIEVILRPRRKPSGRKCLNAVINVINQTTPGIYSGTLVSNVAGNYD